MEMPEHAWSKSSLFHEAAVPHAEAAGVQLEASSCLLASRLFRSALPKVERSWHSQLLVSLLIRRSLLPCLTGSVCILKEPSPCFEHPKLQLLVTAVLRVL